MADVNVVTAFETTGLKELTDGLKSVTKASDSMTKMLERVEKVLDMINVSTSQTNVALVNSVKGFSRAEKDMADSISQAAQAKIKDYKLTEQVIQQNNRLVESENKVINVYRKQATGNLNTRPAAQANRFNTGNIAAQFQDIAVTSAMNMNPLTIGLQQGTQLAYVLGQSKAPLADFAAGIKSLISPVSLLSVGLTALVAAGIQMVDWVSVGKNILNGLANVFETVGEGIQNLSRYLLELTAIGAILYFESLITVAGNLFNVLTSLIKPLSSLIVSFGKFFVAGLKLAGLQVILLALNHPITLISLGIAACTIAVVEFGDTAEKIINYTIGNFVALAYAVGSVGDLIANSFLKGPEKAFDELKKKFNELSRETNYVKIVEGGVDKLNEQTGVVDKLKNKWDGLTSSMKNMFIDASSGLKSMAEDLGKDEKAAKKLEKAINSIKDSYKDLIANYETKIDDAKFENSIRGLTKEDQLVQQIERDYQKQIEKLDRKAAKKGVDLKLIQEEKNKLAELKNGYVELELQNFKNEESMKRYDEAIDYGASLTKGFFSDMKSGLKEGQSAWEAFTNSIIKMLDKISDKMMDLAIDAMFDSMKQDKSKTNSNFLSSIISAGTALVTGSTYYNAAETSAMSSAARASGQVKVMSGSYTGPFAKGGAFTNGVYNSPTMFAFANGGRFGVMGEAGPEAVMPLTRSSDGSLGVKAEGIGGGSPVVVNVINNSNARATTQQRQTEQGTTIDVMIDELVAQKLGQTGTASNQALTAFNNRQLIAR